MKYGADMTNQIAQLLEQGMSREDTMDMVGVGNTQFYEWLKKPDFSEAVKKAEMVCKAGHVQNIRKAGASGVWQASAWWLERRYPQEFGLKNRDAVPPDDIPKAMAERAHKLLQELEARRAHTSGKVNGTGPTTNGTH